ncbi:MAG: rRNA maturation RNase YbeY [Pelagibacterales bacterium]|nr:rRNA maturation RNase YbeY [Pelagibacterales bacterium]
MKKKSRMVKVNLVIEHKSWKSKYPKVNLFLKKSIKKILLSIFPSQTMACEISILLTGTKNMKNLNKKFRKINKDTDVLSFPAEDKNFFKKDLKLKKKVYLGDIALSYQYIEAIIKKENINFDDYFKKMLIHGVLHLIGYEHDSFKKYKKMNLLEQKIIRSIKE